MHRRLAVTLGVAALAAAARAEEPEGTRFARELRATLGASANPLGVQNGFDLSCRRALTESAHPLLADAHLAVGLSSRLTPAYARIGPWVQVAPLSVLEVRAGVEPAGYFGTFHSLLPYAGYGDDFSDTSRRAREGAEAGLAVRAYVAPALQARLGRLILRGRAEFEWWNANAPGPFFYEPFRDTLLRASGDTLMATETLVLWAFRDDGPRRLYVGPVHELLRVPDYPDNRRQDAGLVAVWGLGPRRFGLAEPVVFAKVVHYFEAPNREGTVGAQLAVSVGFGPR